MIWSGLILCSSDLFVHFVLVVGLRRRSARRPGFVGQRRVCEAGKREPFIEMVLHGISFQLAPENGSLVPPTIY